MKSPDPVLVSLRTRNASVRRATLLTESARLFVLRGYEATSIDEIARAADVSRATVFNYFPTKRSILEEHYARLSREFLSLIEASPKGRARKRLRDIFRGAEKILKREGKLFPILYREVFLAPNLTAMDASIELRVFALYVDIIRHAQSSGEIRRSAKPELAARMIIDLWASTLRSWVDGGQRLSLFRELDDKLALLFSGFSGK